MPSAIGGSTGSSPYSTGGGGVRLEHSYAACLVAGLLAGESLSELGDTLTVDSIRLQASDMSEIDDIVVEGRDAQGAQHRSSIAVRRNPALVTSDGASVPLLRDFLILVTDRWSDVSSGHLRLIIAVSTTANAIAQLSELAELARALPSGHELANRMTQSGRTNAGVRDRYKHIKGLVAQASEGLPSAEGLSGNELTWRLLSSLSTRSLRLERTDRADRTAAVNTLRRVLHDGTPAAADALFSRIEELVGTWASQAAVITQSVIRRSLSDCRLSRSPTFATAWGVLDRLGARLRESVRPALQSAEQSLELERPEERSSLADAMRSTGMSAGALVVTGEPDVGKSALSLRVAESLRGEGAAIASLSLRDLPHDVLQLEGQLGGSAIDDIMATGEVSPSRLLIVDGAESVLEGKGQVFRMVAAAALRAGFGVVAVTRTDGSGQVRDELARSCELAGSGIAPAEHVVGPLTHDERDALPTKFTALARLAGHQRASWLLGRPGLVDVLLRTDKALDPADVLCEADVFTSVWQSLIRRDEIRPAGAASPDDREQAALSVAKQTLGIAAPPPHGTAASELRSDGILRRPNNSALSLGDEFENDLFRDFAVCRLLITHGWEPLISAEAPRWSIRAALLACQAVLLDRDRSSAWVDLSAQFSEIAGTHGDRWLELPHEALLTLGDAEPAIRDLWAALTADRCASLAILLRLAEARYVKGTIGDAYALAPLVTVAFCEQTNIKNAPRFGHRNLHEVVQDVVLAWLRGVAVSHLDPDRRRQEVRDVIIDAGPPLYSAFAIEGLAALGPDLDERAEAWLREVAKDRPGTLRPAVESVSVAVSMSQARPQLLLDLAEAYCIELPDPDDHWGGNHYARDDGIRDVKPKLTPGFGVPWAAWYYGPFFRLLNTIPPDAVAFINRMLNHAAGLRVKQLSALRHQNDGPQAPEGIQLDLPGVGSRLYVGDSHVWAWYRGTSVGPYACMSALLALERFIDYLLENVHVPARSIVDLLLRDCRNLAVPGLLVGFLTRHPEVADDLLDPFLASPVIWRLETVRVSSDYGFRVRDPAADKLFGAERRRHTFHETVGEMVVDAHLAGADDRLTKLEAVGSKLIATARAERPAAADDNSDDLAVIESWAAEFRIENYQVSRSGDHVVFQFKRPERIEQVLAPRNAELQTTSLLYGLGYRYGRFNDAPEKWPIDDLDKDLATVRSIEEGDNSIERTPRSDDAIVAVAAAAVRARAMGLAVVSDAHLTWAAEALLRAAVNPEIDEMSYRGSNFTMGADRAAAASVPLLLLAPFDGLGLSRSRIDDGLRSLATSLFDEVRAIYVKGCEQVWAASCEDDGTGQCLRHQSAWVAATSGLIDCKLGPWRQQGHMREHDPLHPPFHEALDAVADDELLVARLRMPLECMIDARRVTCLQSAVSDLWTPLWKAHCRGLAHWWKEGHDDQAHVTHEPIAQRMVEVALDGDRTPVLTHIEAFATNSNALHLLFDGFATVFTYDDELRRSMADFWPWTLEIALDAVGDGAKLRSQDHWFDYLAAALLPTPRPRSWDSDIDGTLARCREGWIQPDAIGELADRWLNLARREPKAVDATITFARCTSLQWQTTGALAWIETLIDGRFDLIANQLWSLEEWLIDLRRSRVITGTARHQYHRIVDGLAAAGDRAAVRVQQLDE